MKNSITEIAYKVKNLGIASFHNFMKDKDLNASREIVKNINCLKAEYQGIFETNIKFRLIDCFLKFRFKKFKYTNYFLNLSKKLCLKQIADGIFNTESMLARIDCYVSPISDQPILDWHVDHAYSGIKNVTKYNSPEEQTIKFFFGLTDMSSDNGCLSYIPKSHIIALALRKGIYEGTLKYTPYWLLDDFRKTILINDNYIYLKKNVDPNILNEFLEKTEPSIFKNESDFKYDYQPIKAGGALIFNDSGLHKGSRTRINERLVLRFFFRKKTDSPVDSNLVAPSN